MILRLSSSISPPPKNFDDPYLIPSLSNASWIDRDRKYEKTINPRSFHCIRGVEFGCCDIAICVEALCTTKGFYR
jgi:hypothetical protein